MTRLKGAVKFILLAGVAAVAAPALASEDGRTLTIRATVDARHESNAARRSADGAQQLGLFREDDRLTPSIDVTIAPQIGRQKLQVGASAGYDFYRRNHRLNRERLSLDALGLVDAGICASDLTARLSRKQSDLADLAAAQAFGANSVSNAQTGQEYGAKLRCGRPYGLQPTLTVDRSIFNNSNPLRRVSDNRTISYGGGLSYANPVLGTFSALYTHARTTYPRRIVLPGGSGYATDRAQLTAARDIGAVLKASGSLSYIWLRPAAASAPRFRGTGWTANLTAAPTPDLQIRFLAASDVTPSAGTDALYQRSKLNGLRATYALNSLMMIDFGGDINVRDYRGAGLTFGNPLTHSVQRSVSGGLTYDLGQRVKLRAETGYERRSANDAIYEYDNIFVALRSSLDF